MVERQASGRTAGLCRLLALVAATLAARPAPAEESRTVRVPTSACDRLVRHDPGPDVAFQPGVDVHGRPVVPADTGAGPLAVPEVIGISIRVDLLERFGIPANPDLFEAEADIGILELEGDRVFFNGRLLSVNEAAEIAAACRESRTAP